MELTMGPVLSPKKSKTTLFSKELSRSFSKIVFSNYGE
jgi:hypothetical protein